MRRGGHYELLAAYNRLSKDARGSKAKVREVFASLVTDAALWAGGDRRLKKSVFLERLGFPEGMQPHSIALYWSKLVQKGIINPDWNYKLAIILEFALGRDPRIWLELQRTPTGQIYPARTAGEVNALSAERGLGMHVSPHTVRSFTKALKREAATPKDSDC
ncbi:MAG: hypothetical protein Q8N84_03535 [bacterium]|nr:hypothetical protein [bacterium]